MEDKNLILNPGAETYNYPIQILPDFPVAENWYPSSRTPDYFNRFIDNPHDSIPSNAFGNQDSNSDGYMGFGTILNGDNSLFAAEGFYGKLSHPTEAGYYLLQFDYSLAEISEICMKHFGIELIMDTLDFGVVSNGYFVEDYLDYEIVVDSINWNRCTALLKATGGEQYIVISSSWSSHFHQTVFPVHRTSYHYVDNFSLRRIIGTYSTNDAAILFPNPSPDGQFTFNYNLSGEQKGVFVVFDATGRKVAEQTVPEGLQSMQLNFPSLASGTYIWRLDQDDALIEHGKLVIAK